MLLYVTSRLCDLARRSAIDLSIAKLNKSPLYKNSLPVSLSETQEDYNESNTYANNPKIISGEW